MRVFLYTFSFLFLISMSNQLHAQGCDGFRYLNDIADEVDVETVQFGQNINGAGATQDLLMDIYTPSGDTETSRPVIIYAFGGSFIGGSRSDGFVVDFCERYARRGYVTVGIDYRLYDLFAQGFPDSLDMIEVVIQAVSDMKGAVRYMRKSADNDNPYGINPDKIYVGGISAGAITAAHTAYVNEVDDVPTYVADIIATNGGIDGDTDLPGDSHLSYSSEVQAVINMSGALHRVSFMEAGDAPIVSSHGDQDGTVPYGFDFANVAGFPIATVQGSSMVHAQAVALGIPSELYTVEGGGHTGFYGQAPHEENIESMIVNFIYNNVTCSSVSTQDLEDVSGAVNIYPNPARDVATIAIDGSLGSYDIMMTNQLGKTIRSASQVNDTVYTIPRLGLASGVYHIHIKFEHDDYAPVIKKVVFK